MTKKTKPKKQSKDDPELELRRNLREHEKRYREQTSADGYREYGSEDNEDGQE